jgi:hypothetical protein
MKREADAKKAAMAKMTPEQRAAAKRARAAETPKYEATMEKITQNPGTRGTWPSTSLLPLRRLDRRPAMAL